MKACKFIGKTSLPLNAFYYTPSERDNMTVSIGIRTRIIRVRWATASISWSELTLGRPIIARICPSSSEEPDAFRETACQTENRTVLFEGRNGIQSERTEAGRDVGKALMCGVRKGAGTFSPIKARLEALIRPS